jgi:amino acid permease
MAPDRSIQFRPATALLVLLAIGFIVLGVIYLTTAADKLPSLMPGHQAHITRHHTKHGIAMFGLAVVALVGAWFSTAPAR